jgi:hypothetical protein
MNGPDVTVTLRGKLDHTSKESRLVPSVGAKLQMKIENAETAFSVDYKSPSNLTLKIDGKIRVTEIRNIEFYVGAGVKAEILKKGNTYEGKLEIKIDKAIAADIQYVKGPKDSYVGAGISINF